MCRGRAKKKNKPRKTKTPTKDRKSKSPNRQKSPTPRQESKRRRTSPEPTPVRSSNAAKTSPKSSIERTIRSKTEHYYQVVNGDKTTSVKSDSGRPQASIPNMTPLGMPPSDGQKRKASKTAEPPVLTVPNVELSLQKEFMDKLRQLGIEVAKETSRSTISKSLNSQKATMTLLPKASRMSTSLDGCPPPKLGSGDTQAKSLIEDKPIAMAHEAPPAEGLAQPVQKLQETSKTQQSSHSGSMAAKQAPPASSPKETKRQSNSKEKKSPKK